ncbi:hypothetical protein BJ912DRAFT_1149146 [Pholiota molesta]|nr:hypothetical protein BJ912DRAFT_1149146 [Pholiota molesta]
MIISSKKYACETCIKGHRSSACKHTDRPLFEIKKKGRPVTQCEHCRELRKQKQVHVKCVCEQKDFPQQGSKPGFESAAFPTGLPPALGASVAFPNSADGASSDSDPGGVLNGHRCKLGDPCTCVTPRTRIRASDASDAHASSSRRAGGGHPMPTPAANILERIYALRPIVPRPPSQGPYTTGGPLHNPSTGIPHGHASRHHDGFTPYGSRHGMTPHSSVPPQSYGALHASPNPTFPYNEQVYDPFQMETWASGPENGGMDMDNLSLPSMCECGDDCSCPGCIHHSRATAIPSSSAYSSCSNPAHCGTCLDCTIMALPHSAILPPNTALSIYDSSEAIDNWLRTMSASNPTDQSAFQQDFLSFQQQQQQQQSPTWNNNSRGYPFPDPTAGGLGGYNPNQPMMPFNATNEPSAGTGAPLSHARQRSQPADDIHIDPRLLPSSARPKGGRSGGGGGDTGMLHPPPSAPFLALPDASGPAARSRSPSTSSQSSHGYHGHASDGGGGGGAAYRPSGRVQGISAYGQQHGHGHARAGAAPPLTMNTLTMNNVNVNVRPGLARGPSSGAGSASPGSAAYAHGGSPPGSAHVDGAGAAVAGGADGGPSLAGLHIY